MYFEEFTAKLASAGLPSLVLLGGDAEDVIAESVRLIQAAYARACPQGERRVLDGAEKDLPALLADARSGSLFSTGKLLVLKRAERRVGGRASEETLSLLSAYLSDPDPSTCLVLAAQGIKRDSRVAKMAQAGGWFVYCASLAPWKAVPWVVSRAAEAGLVMDPGCAQLLLQKAGSDLGLLGNALEQWSLAIHPRTEATQEDLDDLPIPGGGAGIFEFLDLFAARRTKDALRWLGGEGRSATGGLEDGTLAMLCGRVRELLAMAAMREAGIGEDEAISRLRMHPFRGKNLWKQARGFKSSELEPALLEAIRLQSGPVTGRLTKASLLRGLERWILKRRGTTA